MIGNSYIIETDGGTAGYYVLSKVPHLGYKVIRVYQSNKRNGHIEIGYDYTHRQLEDKHLVQSYELEQLLGSAVSVLFDVIQDD